MDNCYFCNNEETILFQEHYIFCPNCTAIYTDLMIQKSNCDHIKDGVVVAIREPWYAKNRNVPFIKEEVNIQEDNIQWCSVCAKPCVADGW